MNQKTAKLLKKYAGATGEQWREVVRSWLSLNRHQRAADRRRIRAKVDG
jgi:hypothetical protein